MFSNKFIRECKESLLGGDAICTDMTWSAEVPDGVYKVVIEYYDTENNFYSDIMVNGQKAFHSFNTFGYGEA